MKLDEIQEQWNRDREIDYTDLGIESIRIPQIHDKYLKVYTDERIRLRALEFELTKLTHAKTEYYTGRMSEDELTSRGWEPYLGRLLKNEVSGYVEADNDILEIKQRIVILQEKVNYLDAILRMINNRGFQIKNALDWMKFTNGNN